jgi:hypothetical protein
MTPRHLTPKERALIVEPRLELKTWQDYALAMTYHRVEIAGEPVTCAWKSAREAWAAALRALRPD